MRQKSGPRKEPAEKVVRHGRYVTFQLAEVAAPRELFGNP
jgi:hypothetical protein